MTPREQQEAVAGYLAFLQTQERSAATQKQYQREARAFMAFAADRAWSKELVIQYKQALQQRYRPASVNAKLAALNGFFAFLGRNELRVRQLRIQRQTYCPAQRELTRQEYLRLVETAKRQKKEKLALLLQTICATGMRVSELQYITAEAVERGEAVVSMKGKTRCILIPGRLRKALKRYQRQQKIASGPLFITRSGRPLDRSNIWKMMKALSRSAGVEAEKVFPHNLRHLFARCFYALDKDIAKLADVLGHSSINTTRLYIISTGWEHRRQMSALGLVV